MTTKRWISAVIAAVGWIAVAHSQILPPQRTGSLADEPLLFDRLFTFADERRALDRERNNPSDPPPAKPALEQAPPLAAPEVIDPIPDPPLEPRAITVFINGLVLREDGHHTVWVNGSAITPGSPNADGVTVVVDAMERKLYLQWHPNTVRIAIKPGQHFDSAYGEVREGY